MGNCVYYKAKMNWQKPKLKQRLHWSQFINHWAAAGKSIQNHYELTSTSNFPKMYAHEFDLARVENLQYHVLSAVSPSEFIDVKFIGILYIIVAINFDAQFVEFEMVFFNAQ